LLAGWAAHAVLLRRRRIEILVVKMNGNQQFQLSAAPGVALPRMGLAIQPDFTRWGRLVTQNNQRKFTI
jgi:hypothetical protein